MRRTKTMDPAGAARSGPRPFLRWCPYARIGVPAVLLGLPMVTGAQAATGTGPEAVVDRQVAAYNRHDLDGFLDTYSDNISFHTFGSAKIAHAKATLHDAVVSLFSRYPNIQSKTLARVGFGSFVVDREELSGLGDRPPLTILSVYEVRSGHIVNYWQSPFAKPNAGDAPAQEPDPTARATVDQLRTAFNKHDLDGAIAEFADTIAHYTLTRDTVSESLTRDEMRDRMSHLFEHGRRPHVVARAQVAVGPYVAARETVDGLPADQPAGDLVIAQVENGKIVALWEAS
jgi:hypothetical protein